MILQMIGTIIPYLETQIAPTWKAAQIPDITGVSYFGDGKYLNATIWFACPFQETPFPTSSTIRHDYWNYSTS